MATVQLPGYNRRDSLDTILKGLQIAGGIYNIKGAMEKSDALAAQRAEQSKLAEQQIAKGEFEAREREMAEKGFTSPYQQTQLTRQGIQFVPEGTQGAISFGMTPDQKPLFGTTPAIRERQLQKLADVKQKQRDDDLLLGEAKEEFSDKRNVRLAAEQYDAANQVKQFLKEGKGVIDSIALRNVFRMSGDVGAIRQEDLKQLGASPAIIDELKLFLRTKKEGDRILFEDRKNLARASDIIQDLQEEKIRKEGERLSSSLARRTSFREEEIFDFIEPMQVLGNRIKFLDEEISNDLSQEPSMFDLVPTVIGQPPQRPEDKESVINKFLGE